MPLRLGIHFLSRSVGFVYTFFRRRRSRPSAVRAAPKIARLAGSGTATCALLRKNLSGPPVALDILADSAAIQLVLKPAVFCKALASVASSPKMFMQLLPCPAQTVRSTGVGDRFAVNSKVVPAALNTRSWRLFAVIRLSFPGSWASKRIRRSVALVTPALLREGVPLLGLPHGDWVSPVHVGPGGLTDPVSIVLLPGLCNERTMAELPTPPGTEPGVVSRKIKFADAGGDIATRAPKARPTVAKVKLAFFTGEGIPRSPL